MVANDFPRDPSFRALSDYEVTLPKVDDELPGGNAYANDPNLGFSVDLQRFVHERATRENEVMSPLKLHTILFSQKTSFATFSIASAVSSAIVAIPPFREQFLTTSELLAALISSK